MKTILNLIKIKHWIKNFFIFAPLIFSLQLFNPDKILYTLIAFISFCFISVLIYIINDIKDRKNDAIHPKKKLRPIASGKIKPAAALIIGFIFFSIGITLSVLFNNISSTLIILLYFVLNIFYTFLFKGIAILDVFIIAIGFCLRVLLGADVISVSLSNWMLLATFSISLIIGFGKRRQELYSLGDNAENYRNNLTEYTQFFLDIMIIISTSLTIVSYALYTMDPITINKFNTTNLIFTVPFVLFGVFRYLHLIYCKGKGGSPEDIVSSDPGIIITVVLWIITVLILIYNDLLINNLNLILNFLNNKLMLK